jgi:hypothetical protein
MVKLINPCVTARAQLLPINGVHPTEQAFFIECQIFVSGVDVTFFA